MPEECWNPEHKRPIEELQAGNAFRDSVIDKSDATRGGAPLWHGWVIMDAFLAGIDWARAQEQLNRLPAHPTNTQSRQ